MTENKVNEANNVFSDRKAFDIELFRAEFTNDTGGKETLAILAPNTQKVMEYALTLRKDQNWVLQNMCRVDDRLVVLHPLDIALELPKNENQNKQ